MASVRFEYRQLNPVAAELWLIPEPGAELTGRVVGPRSDVVSTIEVSYPLQSLPRSVTADPAIRRVLIPEPSLWTPEMPFVYRVEINHGAERLAFDEPLRRFEVKPQGCRLNGQPIELRALQLEAGRVDLSDFRGKFNAIVVEAISQELITAADRAGFLVIARLADDKPHFVRPWPAAWWLSNHSALQPPEWARPAGIRLASVADEVPEWAAFVLCEPALAGLLGERKIPTIILDSMP